ncbi:MAG TPA: NAD+ synthase [Bacteroidales bacterium]|nr:NAD+ synthase [Bacteroidales bacterium]
MKIALAQLSYIPGDTDYNSGKIISAIGEARAQNAEIVIFSELAVTGYPPLDLLNREEIIAASMAAVRDIASHCHGIAAIVGAPSPNTGVYGKGLHNSAFFMYDGKIKAVINKALLPTYDIFDEARYFEPGNVFQAIDYKGIKIAVTICEDIWAEQPCANRGICRYYGIIPLDELVRDDPRLIINIAANPFAHNRIRVREEIFRKNALEYKLPLISVNQTGGYTDLIFDGSSVVIDASGRTIVRLAFCTVELRVVDVPVDRKKDESPQDETSPDEAGYPDDMTPYIHKALVTGISDFFAKSGQKKAVVGLSGGIDSAVVLALAAEALGPQNVMAVLMPSVFSSKHSVTDSVELAGRLGVPYHTVNIEEARLVIESSVKPFFGDRENDITEENIQARLRAVILMAFANKLGYMLLNTSNKSEAATGYGTLYGDMAGGLSVMGDLYKTEVYRLAKEINSEREIIPENIITKPPSAELKADQRDTDSLPPYDLLDPILYRYIDLERSPGKIIEEGYDGTMVETIVRLVRTSEFKRRQTPPVLRVSFKSFGSGRRIPIISRY